MANEITVTKQTSFSLAPTTFEEAIRFAEILAKSDFTPRDYQGKPGNVLAALQMGAELGLAPMQALQNISVINGRPSVWGDAALAIVRNSPHFESMNETDDGTTATCVMKRKGHPAITRQFSMDDARRAGLLAKKGPWQEYPARMRQMRARSWALRDLFPDVLRGLITREEAQDYIDVEIIKPTPAPPPVPFVMTPLPHLPQEPESNVQPQSRWGDTGVIDTPIAEVALDENALLALLTAAQDQAELDSVKAEIKKAGLTRSDKLIAAYLKKLAELKRG